MSDRASLLIEIGCEELPARLIDQQLELLSGGLSAALAEVGLTGQDSTVKSFGTPRRLAVRIADVAARQPDQVLERKGPAVEVAFDADGRPTKAAEGFARSVGREVGSLERLSNDQGEWLFARVEQPGRALAELLPQIFRATVETMAGARSMRWSDREERFLRPVRWIVALHGDRVVEFEAFGLSAGRVTLGHRIHAPGGHELERAEDYERVLEKAFVAVSQPARAEHIRGQVESLAERAGLAAIIDPGLLAEVAGLTEWPVAVMGGFQDEFLEVPEEALISSMEQHQKCFALRDAEGGLAPRFIAVANIESADVAAMTAGFERVIHPRLADARFFWDQDRKRPLAERRSRLDQVLFQEKLGSIGDKVARLERLAPALAPMLSADPDLTRRAAGLSKCDLLTEMVGEFPELQGIMGRYYALADGEDPAVAQAIESHYRPRQAGDELATDAAGLTLALADRLDTLVGVFAAGQKPKGGKDPFALRRAALGVLRILDASGCRTSLGDLVARAAESYAGRLEIDDKLLGQVEQFIFERLRPWAAEQDIEANTVHAVGAGVQGSVADFMARARAVQAFADDPVAASLIAANKRASNLLKQAGNTEFNAVDENLLQIDEERQLFNAITAAEAALEESLQSADYPTALARLAELRVPVDRFFDEVMVMADEQDLRDNRLALLARLRALFLQVADVARLGR